MTRYTIDAPTLVHLIDQDLHPHASHQLVAPASLRSETLGLLLDDVRAGRRTDKEALAVMPRHVVRSGTARP